MEEKGLDYLPTFRPRLYITTIIKDILYVTHMYNAVLYYDITKQSCRIVCSWKCIVSLPMWFLELNPVTKPNSYLLFQCFSLQWIFLSTELWQLKCLFHRILGPSLSHSVNEGGIKQVSNYCPDPGEPENGKRIGSDFRWVTRRWSEWEAR